MTHTDVITARLERLRQEIEEYDRTESERQIKLENLLLPVDDHNLSSVSSGSDVSDLSPEEDFGEDFIIQHNVEPTPSSSSMTIDNHCYNSIWHNIEVQFPYDADVHDKIRAIVERMIGGRHDQLNRLSDNIQCHYNLNIQDSNIYKRKMKVREEIFAIAKKAIQCTALYAVGSTINGCGAYNCDMDLCATVPGMENLNFQEKQNKEFEQLNILKTALRDSLFISTFNVQTIDLIPARVPILKLNLLDSADCDALEIDVNINNVAGVYNSYLVNYYTLFDERFAALALLLKHWGINAGVIDAQNGRINSYTLLLLLVHYLQCAVEPAVLPDFFSICPKDFDERCISVHQLHNSKLDMLSLVPGRRANKQTLGELLLGFFVYYASIFDFDTYGISIRRAKIMLRSRMGRVAAKRFSLIVEEPYDRENAARCVLRNQNNQMLYIVRAFKDACDQMTKTLDLVDIGVDVGE